MKKPIHATPNAQPLTVLVFPIGDKKASHTFNGIDPADLARKTAKAVDTKEARKVRPQVHKALAALIDGDVLPSVRAMTLEIGGRNIRVRANA